MPRNVFSHDIHGNLIEVSETRWKRVLQLRPGVYEYPLRSFFPSVLSLTHSRSLFIQFPSLLFSRYKYYLHVQEMRVVPPLGSSFTFVAVSVIVPVVLVGEGENGGGGVALTCSNGNCRASWSFRRFAGTFTTSFPSILMNNERDPPTYLDLRIRTWTMLINTRGDNDSR